MTITPIGFIFAAFFVTMLIGGRSSFIWAIAVSMFFQDSAMVVVGTVGLAPYTVALIVALVLQVVFVVRTKRSRRHPALPIGLLAAGSPAGVWLRRSLLVLLVYGVVVSAIGPWLFEGVLVMPSQGAFDYLVDRLPHLTYSLSNAAQVAYLILNVVLVWFISTLPRLPVAPFFVAVAVTALVVLIAVGLAAVRIRWPFEFFDNSPRNYYAVLANDPRLRASFSEPSHLAWFLAMAMAYAARLLPIKPAWRRGVAVGILVIGFIAFLGNPSTTIILTLAVIAPAAGVVIAVRYRRALLSRRGVLTTAAIILALGSAVVVLWAPLTEFFGPALLGKIGGSSQYSRGKQDLNAFSLFAQTFGLGVGLGSNRSSSLLTMLLSDLGLVGTVAYYAVIVLSAVILFRRGASPEGWALTALAVACAISVADFVSPPTWFLVGMAAYLSRPAVRFGGAHRRPVVAGRLPLLTGVSR